MYGHLPQTWADNANCNRKYSKELGKAIKLELLCLNNYADILYSTAPTDLVFALPIIDRTDYIMDSYKKNIDYKLTID